MYRAQIFLLFRASMYMPTRDYEEAPQIAAVGRNMLFRQFIVPRRPLALKSLGYFHFFVCKEA
jgi:hypothetical protein